MVGTNTRKEVDRRSWRSSGVSSSGAYAASTSRSLCSRRRTNFAGASLVSCFTCVSRLDDRCFSESRNRMCTLFSAMIENVTNFSVLELMPSRSTIFTSFLSLLALASRKYCSMPSMRMCQSKPEPLWNHTFTFSRILLRARLHLEHAAPR